jgi:hypothetical protein
MFQRKNISLFSIGLTLTFQVLSAQIAKAQTSAPLVNPPNDTNFNAADQAKKSSGSDMNGLIQSLMGAALMMPPCMATPPCQACCVMAAQALAQAPASGASAAGATGAGQNMSVSGQPTTVARGPLPGGTDAQVAEFKKLSSQLAKTGVKVENGRITLPSGKSLALNTNLSSESAVKSAGFSAGEGQLVKDLLKDIATKPGQAISALNGDTSDSGIPGGSASSGDSGNSKYGAPAKPKTPASLAGLAKSLGDDRIGVSADDIFGMISRRYKTEDTVNQFLK